MESLGPASIAELHSNLAKAFRRKNCLFRPCRSSVCVFFAVHLPIISKQSMISTTAYMTELSHLNKCNFWAPHSFSRQTKRAQRCGGCRDAEAQTPDPDPAEFSFDCCSLQFRGMRRIMPIRVSIRECFGSSSSINGPEPNICSLLFYRPALLKLFFWQFGSSVSSIQLVSFVTAAPPVRT